MHISIWNLFKGRYTWCKVPKSVTFTEQRSVKYRVPCVPSPCSQPLQGKQDQNSKSATQATVTQSCVSLAGVHAVPPLEGSSAKLLHVLDCVFFDFLETLKKQRHIITLPIHHAETLHDFFSVQVLPFWNTGCGGKLVCSVVSLCFADHVQKTWTWSSATLDPKVSLTWLDPS